MWPISFESLKYNRKRSKVETIKSLISQVIEETELRVQRQRARSQPVFSRGKQRMDFARHRYTEQVTAILPPKREVDFAYFGY